MCRLFIAVALLVTVVAAKNTCTKCLRVRYCGAECQREDWKFHKRICEKPKAPAAAAPAAPPQEPAAAAAAGGASSSSSGSSAAPAAAVGGGGSAAAAAAPAAASAPFVSSKNTEVVRDEDLDEEDRAALAAVKKTGYRVVRGVAAAAGARRAPRARSLALERAGHSPRAASLRTPSPPPPPPHTRYPLVSALAQGGGGGGHSLCHWRHCAQAHRGGRRGCGRCRSVCARPRARLWRRRRRRRRRLCHLRLEQRRHHGAAAHARLVL